MLFTQIRITSMSKDAISIGRVPTGSAVIRKATIEDLRADPSRLAMVQTPDGRYVWLAMTRPEEKQD